MRWAQDDMTLQRYWYINGQHYSLTLEAWLARMDQHRREIMPIMQVQSHGRAIQAAGDGSASPVVPIM